MPDPVPELPIALTTNEQFREVSERERLHMIQRLAYILEISENIDLWFLNKEEPLEFILEDVELDVIACMDLRTEDKRNVSIWLLHTVFVSETNAEELRGALSARQFAWLDTALSTHAETGEVEDWLCEFGRALRETLDRFFAAGTYAEAMAHHIAVDALVANGAGTLAKLHFNRFLAR